MFDDKPSDQPMSQGARPTPPVNLPTGVGPAMIGPEPPRPMLPPEPEDILGDVDKTEPLVKGPTPMTPQPLTKQAAIPPRAKPVTKEPFFKQHKKAFATIVTVIVAGGFLAAGWYTYRLLVPTSSQPVQNQNSAQPANVNTNTAAVNQNTNQPVGNINGTVNAAAPNLTGVGAGAGAAATSSTEVLKTLDSDHDGLTDYEEIYVYHTNPNNPDSDNDGLTDRDEVKVFNTDPNNADTDGDGYTDGVEVRNGFDPKGPGKLLIVQ